MGSTLDLVHRQLSSVLVISSVHSLKHIQDRKDASYSI